MNTDHLTVTRCERRVRPGMMPSLFLAPGVQDGTPDVGGLYAEIETSDGRRLEWSRLDGEDQWTLDAHWGPGSFPHFSNGFGSRCTLTSRANAETAALLDTAALLVRA